MQTRMMSIFEITFGQAIGFLIGYLTNILVLPAFGFQVNLHQAIWITLIFSAVSIARGYVIRRFFNWLHGKGF